MAAPYRRRGVELRIAAILVAVDENAHVHLHGIPDADDDINIHPDAVARLRELTDPGCTATTDADRLVLLADAVRRTSRTLIK